MTTLSSEHSFTNGIHAYGFLVHDKPLLLGRERLLQRKADANHSKQKNWDNWVGGSGYESCVWLGTVN